MYWLAAAAAAAAQPAEQVQKMNVSYASPFKYLRHTFRSFNATCFKQMQGIQTRQCVERTSNRAVQDYVAPTDTARERTV